MSVLPIVLQLASLSGVAPTVDRSAAVPPVAAPAVSASRALRIVENRGQWPSRYRFGARAGGARIAFSASRWRVYCGDSAFDFVPQIDGRELEGEFSLSGECEDRARFHFASRGASVHGARSFSRLRYAGQRGIDLVFREGPAGICEYDVEVERARALAQLTVRVDGAERVRIDARTGELVCVGRGGELRHSAPVTYGLRPGGERVPLRARFVRIAATVFGFRLAEEHRDFEGKVVVDPGLVWSSYLGGSGDTEGIYDVKVASDGSTYVCGYTDSVLFFPVTNGARQRVYAGGALDGFVARIAADGRSLIWCSYFGGNGEDSLIRLMLAGDGSIWAGGYTSSANFPTTSNAWSAQRNGTASDATVLQLDVNGVLRFASYFGGTGGDVVRGFAEDGQGRVYIAGITGSSDFPASTGAYQTRYGGGWDSFVLRVDGAARRIAWASLLGGPLFDDCWALDVSAAGEVVLGVSTKSAGLPVSQGAIGGGFRGGAFDGYVARFDAGGAKLVASSYVAGTGDDRIRALRVLPDDSIALVGWSDSTNLPVAFASQGTPAGNFDGYAAQFDKGMQRVLWGSYLGGGANDFLWDLHIDEAGTWTVAGLSYATDFPVTAGCYKNTIGRGASSGGDLVIARLAPWLRPFSRQVVYASYIGGRDAEYGYALDVRGQVATIAGETWSDNYEVTAGSFQRTRGSMRNEAMVTRIDLLPASCTRYGTSTPCVDDFSFEPSEHATRGNQNFALLAGAAPASSAGILALGVPTNTGLPVLGAQVFLDPVFPILTFPLVSDAAGKVELKLPLPMQSLRFAFQAFFVRSANCRAGGVLLASPTLDFRVQ